jgi:hypothetical protein
MGNEDSSEVELSLFCHFPGILIKEEKKKTLKGK